MKKLIIASHNKKKAAELKTILEPLGYNLILADEAGLPDVEETETTFIGNAKLKLDSAFKHTDEACLADDSGFCVDALDGAPGVYSARYEGGYNRVLQEIEGKERTAHFYCVIAYCNKQGEQHYFEGKVEGTIPENPQGEGGFGYDPIFIPNGGTQTFAEIPQEEKNKLSARSIALAKLAEHIKKEG